MDRIYDCCCGIDVHKHILVACLIKKGEKDQMQSFGTTTKELLRLSDWLDDAECEMVAMESTASYWKPLYNVLEMHEQGAMVVNAAHMKAVPGRKTDVKDAAWIADLLQHGLLKASYIPKKEQRELRELCAYRKSLVRDRAAELNRFQKMLEGGNIKLSGTVSNIVGKNATVLVNAMLNGTEINQQFLDEKRENGEMTNQLKASDSELIDAMEGVLSPLQIKMMKEVMAHIQELTKHIDALSEDIDNFMSEEEKKAVQALCDIPGIGEESAQQIIAVIGTDMSRFPSADHLCSWAGLCPGNNESAGKRRSGRTNKGNKLLKTTLVNCASSAKMKKGSYFKAQFERLKVHRGNKRATVAVAHSILIAIYHVLAKGEKFKDLGEDYFNQFHRDRKINSYVKKLKSLGMEVTLVPAS